MEQLRRTQIKKEFHFLKGLFFYQTTENNCELDILKIFNKFLIDPSNNEISITVNPKIKLPNYINLLLCHDNLRDIKDIYAFCVRAINCKTNSLFIIVRPEKLPTNQVKILLNTLNEQLKIKDNKINSCIIVLYINQNSNVIQLLKKLKEKHNFPEEPPIFKTVDNSIPQDYKELPIEIVTSDVPFIVKTNY